MQKLDAASPEGQDTWSLPQLTILLDPPCPPNRAEGEQSPPPAKPTLEFKVPESPTTTQLVSMPWSPSVAKTGRLDEKFTKDLQEIQVVATTILTSASQTVAGCLGQIQQDPEELIQRIEALKQKYHISQPILDFLSFEHVFSKLGDTAYQATYEKFSNIIENLKRNKAFKDSMQTMRRDIERYVTQPLILRVTSPFQAIPLDGNEQMLRVIITLREMHRAYEDAAEAADERSLNAMDTARQATLAGEPSFKQWCAVIQQNAFKKLLEIKV